MEPKAQIEAEAEMTIGTTLLGEEITVDQGQVTLTPPAAVVANSMEDLEIPALLELQYPTIVML